MDRGPALDAALVEEFVRVAHGDLDRVKEFLAKESRLVNAAWDWGDGDFETALGGASHMGRKDIANYLLAHGARLDLFAAAMLGKIALVQAVLKDFADARNVRGPHGIPLLAHAQAGGDDARSVAEFLASLA